MKRVVHQLIGLTITLALVIGCTVFGVGNVKAQTGAPGTWQSSINLQNVGTESATVAISFYDAAGTLKTTYTPSPIAANGALSIFVPSAVTALAGGQFSAVVSSNQQVKVSVNTGSTNSATAPWTSFAYEGIGSTETGTTLYFPGLYKSYYGFNSEMVIQNTGTAAATLSADFYNRSGTKLTTISLGSVPANASKTFGTASLTALPSGNSTGVFGAVVKSTNSVPVAGIANIWRTNGTASYNAFVSGTTKLYAPALYKKYYGFGSALTLQNVATTGNATGNIIYSNGKTQAFDLAPNAAQEFYQPNNTELPEGNTAGVFAAKVELNTSSASKTIVGIVSLSVPDGSSGDFGSYNVPMAASANVNIPNVMANYYGFFTAVTVQNTGASATNITIKYANGTSKTFSNVAANGTVNIIHLTSAGTVLTGATSTSAVVSSSNGMPLVAVLQHNTANGVTGYNASKKPSDFLSAITGSPK